MDDVETFRAAFIASGIDIDRLIARAQQDDVKKKLIADTNDAVSQGCFRVAHVLCWQGNVSWEGPARDVRSDVEQTSRSNLKTA